MSRSGYDIAIAGGGMVGISLALCLRRQLGPGPSMVLLESHPLALSETDSPQTYTPSFDARSTALSYSSCLIYREMELWTTLQERACPIETVHVSEQGRFGSTLMAAADYGWPALGYILENAWLGRQLLQSLADIECETRSPVRVESASPAGAGMRLELDTGEQIDSKLLVVADGASSQLRASLGVAVAAQDYRQHALIANIGHASPHGQRAYERFTPGGPLALLPLLPGVDGESRSALVWSLGEAEAQALGSCSDAEFLAQLQARFGYRLGRLQRVGERFSYPLALVEAREQVRSGVVIMGNAAHSLHPVAGQGFNLALRDIACLGRVLKQAQEAGSGLGELAVLQRYVQQQARDQQQTTAFSDRLPGIFMHRDPALALLRDVGLFALDLSPALKREFVRHTSGVAASSEYRRVQP